MILYSVVTTYHLLEAIVHKINYHTADDTTLMLSHWLKNKYPWYKDLECIFSKVITFNAQYLYSDTLEIDLNERFSEIMDAESIDLSTLEEIHVFGAEHSFGAFLFCNQIPCIYWEEGAGALSKTDDMLEIFLKVHDKPKALFQYEHHLGDGDCPWVQKRYYNKYYQLKEVTGDNLIHFDLAEELEQMVSQDRDVLIRLFYGKNKIRVTSNTALVLTEHFANLSVMSWEEQQFLYKYMVDYFLNKNNLLFKPHPDDTMYYEYIFNNCNVIRKKFPAELLPFIFENLPATVATSSSTSIYGLREKFENVLEFNFEFSHKRQFYKLNRYYIAMSILNDYVKNGATFRLLGVNTVIVDNFQKFLNLCNVKYESYTSIMDALKAENLPAVWIIDEIDTPHINTEKVCSFLESLHEESIVIFMNTDNTYCFYYQDKKELWHFFYPVQVTMTELNGNDHTVDIAGPHVNKNKQEMIYLYTKGVKIEMYEFQRELPNVGVTVKSITFEGDKRQIKILEGMLEATEKRLLYYIEREKELLTEMEGNKK